jgi:hypothetical protein
METEALVDDPDVRRDLYLWISSYFRAKLVASSLHLHSILRGICYERFVSSNLSTMEAGGSLGWQEANGPNLFASLPPGSWADRSRPSAVFRPLSVPQTKWLNLLGFA